MALFRRCCPSLSFLPEPVTVAASARGLLYCRGRATRGYYVCNPATTAWTALSPPGNDHGTDPAIALVFDKLGVCNFHTDYRIVCATLSAGRPTGGRRWRRWWRTIPWGDMWTMVDLVVWELGEMEGRVSCTCVKAALVGAWVMGDGGWEAAGEWIHLGFDKGEGGGEGGMEAGGCTGELVRTDAREGMLGIGEAAVVDGLAGGVELR